MLEVEHSAPSAASVRVGSNKAKDAFKTLAVTQVKTEGTDDVCTIAPAPNQMSNYMSNVPESVEDSPPTLEPSGTDTGALHIRVKQPVPPPDRPVNPSAPSASKVGTAPKKATNSKKRATPQVVQVQGNDGDGVVKKPKASAKPKGRKVK
ncbi:uncharacterized protein MELLADRAFT_59613 [Melampsora larici-populina 98AG31]|uniref:Uncharacterized protein n=1 Tax=Melampsora larici-populina (strain 98AG31 / pathotype 3-4-7) TaxID=747676 RepID=F4R858_MELLP|nr:uncharacterized protein MELLADRAFT_59613 [Melampsora larici-populina 98AG31]EGG11435.1 hypothetical protein MELLADRAFT_59613 [Melampsora larici-populina 98AG31]